MSFSFAPSFTPKACAKSFPNSIVREALCLVEANPNAKKPLPVFAPSREGFFLAEYAA
jgi:hypothetical protein